MDQRDGTNRDLLFGLLAMQIGLLGQEQLLNAFRAWTRDKVRPMADYLVERGDLDADDRAAIEVLVGRHLRRHRGDAAQSLAAVNVGRSTRKGLAGLSDPDIEATLGHAGSASGATEPEESDRTGTYIAAAGDGTRFRVLRPHAKGGLGAVFVALDAELHREVALKQILDRHADDPNSRTRFVLEAEITGGLEHPGIVPVYGLGSYGDGRPYYAMRFVRGDSLKEAVAAFHADPNLKSDPGRRSLALRKLLRRFVDVCNAIDYAHTRGVLHRDIKPANVIVGRHGETLVVDWGLAKAMGKADPGAPADERTLMPSSASETAETLPGATMGTPAYMSPEQAAGDLDRIGPRSDVYSLGATLYSVLTGMPPFEGDDLGAVLKHVGKGNFPPPRSVQADTDPALEAVCLKAMATDPAGRYPSARALADDVERWAADEPVSAWREPFSRRARRWGRRNRTAVAVAAVTVLAAFFGTGAVLAVQTRANARLRQANADLAVANTKVTRANADLQAANERERQRFDLAVEAVRRYHTGVSEDFLLKQDLFKDLRDRLLRDAIDFYRKLETLLAAQADRRSRRALGQAYADVADLTDKVGSIPEALAAHGKALDVRRALSREAPDDPSSSADVGRSLIAVGIVLSRTGRHDEALAAFAEARSVLEATDPPGPERDVVQGDLARSYYWAGVTFYVDGKPHEATVAYEKAREIAGTLAVSRPDLVDVHRLLSWCYNDLGRLLHFAGRRAEALEATEESRRIKERVVKDHPGIPEYLRDLAISYANLGVMRKQDNDPEAGLSSLRKALAIQEGLAAAYPAVAMFHTHLANWLNETGDALRMLGRAREARAVHGRAIAICDRLIEANPALRLDQSWLLQGLRGLGAAELDLGRPSAAVTAWRRAIAIDDLLHFKTGETLTYLASCHALLGGVAGAPGSGLSADDGPVEFERAMQTLRRAVAAGYREADWMRRDPDLTPILSRADFRLLMFDAAFPSDPFAR